MADLRNAAALVKPVDIEDIRTHGADLSGFGRAVGAREFDVVMIAVPAGGGAVILDAVLAAAPAAGLNIEDTRPTLMARTINELVSTCHRARVRPSDLAPDFIGEDKPTIGTAHFICEECGQPCNVEPAS